jgi:hypothetical protein
MKKLITGIIIGITLSLGTLTLATSTVKLIMVPEYINGYKTTELLEYVAELKDRMPKPEVRKANTPKKQDKLGSLNSA